MSRDGGHHTVPVPKLTHNSLIELFSPRDCLRVVGSFDFCDPRDARQFPVTGKRHAIKAIFRHCRTPPSVTLPIRLTDRRNNTLWGRSRLAGEWGERGTASRWRAP